MLQLFLILNNLANERSILLIEKFATMLNHHCAYNSDNFISKANDDVVNQYSEYFFWGLGIKSNPTAYSVTFPTKLHTGYHVCD
ncbi:hypothetical protein [Neisseria iguanae]|uniref:hypothetical protein n=1 Tax=Neisseria iguanae TaxID=90242 RepID=UPI0011B266F6|nr:hypothetical protein [Neisseria iguanae]